MRKVSFSFSLLIHTCARSLTSTLIVFSFFVTKIYLPCTLESTSFISILIASHFFSFHTLTVSCHPKTRAAICQVWIDSTLAEMSTWPILDAAQIFSLRWDPEISKNASCAIMVMADTDRSLVRVEFGQHSTQQRFLQQKLWVLLLLRYFVHNSAEIKKMHAFILM